MSHKKDPELRKIRLTKCVLARMSRGLSLNKASEYYGLKHNNVLWWVDMFSMTDKYAKARENMYDVLARDIEELACAPIERAPDGKLDPTALGQRKLQIEARRWYLGKVTKKYSDKTQIEHSGEVTQNTRVLKPFRGKD